MLCIEAPEVYTVQDNFKSIFLAGGITNCPDWQSEMVSMLGKCDVALLNPRRKNFPMDDPNAAKGQIKWEYEHLRKADSILFWFPKESICPIALYELGAWSMTDTPLFIGVHPEYERRVDIEEQTKLVRPSQIIANSLMSLSESVVNNLYK